MKIAIALLLTTLTACSGMTVDTNFGSFAIQNAKAESVDEYDVAEIQALPARPVTAVDAAYCQLRPTDPEPSRKALVEALKVKARGAGGNALVVDTCRVTLAGDCTKHMMCRGMVYDIEEA